MAEYANLTCISCQLLFAEPAAQRHHYKTDWHRYNLKRKVADLPPISHDLFALKVEQARTEQTQVTNGTAEVTRCECCAKLFRSADTYDNHCRSRKHLQAMHNYVPQEHVVASKKEESDVEEETEVVEDDNDDQWLDASSDEDTDEQVSVSVIGQCLFCEHMSANTELSLQHMCVAHGFFIPDLEYCTDVDGLVQYLGEKVRAQWYCLWCNDRGKVWQSLQAAHKHMQDRQHCKLWHEGNAMLEYADYYDYSSSYPDAPQSDADSMGGSELLVASDWQLALPSGAVVGHRSLMRYYKQRLRAQALPKQVKVKKTRVEKLLSDYRAIGWTGTSGEMATRKARDMQFMQQVYSKKKLQLQMRTNWLATKRGRSDQTESIMKDKQCWPSAGALNSAVPPAHMFAATNTNNDCAGAVPVMGRVSHHRSRSQDNLYSTGISLTDTLLHTKLTDVCGGALPKVSSSNAIHMHRQQHPVGDPIKHLESCSKSVRVVNAVPAVRRAADMRIKKTKNTVTELQRAKIGLEAQLSELTKTAETRSAENAILKFQNRNLREQLDKLEIEHTADYKNDLSNGSGDVDRQRQVIMLDACTSPCGNRLAQTQQSSDTDNDRDRDMQVAQSLQLVADWDRKSVCSEASLACLQDRIVQMEDAHYETTEELQATLAELTELQDIVDEMNNDIGQLTEQNRALTDGLQQRNCRLENSSLQIENLKYLLLSALPQASSAAHDTDQQHEHERMLALLKATYEEHEDLKYRYFEVQKHAHEQRAEHRQMADLCESLKRRLHQQKRTSTGTGDEQLHARLIHNQTLTTNTSTNSTCTDIVQTQHTLAQADAVQSLQERLTDMTGQLHLYKQRLVTVDDNEAEHSRALRERLTEITTENSKLVQQLQEIATQRSAEQEDWRQFQADLQTAVVVANQFKVEAQEQLDQMQDDKHELQQRVRGLTEEIAQLRQRSVSHTISPLSSRMYSRGMQSRMSSLLAQGSPSYHRMDNSEPVSALGAGAGGGSVSNVRALVDALESVDSPPPSATVGGRLSSVPSAHSTRKSAGDVFVSNMSSGCSDPHLHTNTRPSMSVVLPSAGDDHLEMVCSTPVTEPCDRLLAPDGGPSTTVTTPKGILVRQSPSVTNQPSAVRKLSYFTDSDGLDPLAKLLKDQPRGSTRRNALLKWCQTRLVMYKDVEITNFSSSWNDGLAFCALLHSYIPDKVPMKSLNVQDKRRNFSCAFECASAVGVPALWTVDEMVALERPDWKAVMAYVTAVYKHFECNTVSS